MNLVDLNKKAYNRIASHFSATRSALWPEFNEFTSYLADGQRILDWGCGSGRLVLMLANKKCEYFGTDQSTGLLKQARQIHQTDIKKGWVHFYSTATRDKQFPPQYFDIIFLIASFFHLPNERARLALLKKLSKELKPGGRICMTLWNLGSSWANKKKASWKQLGENDYLIPWKDQAGKILAERYYHHFTPEEIKRLLEQTGFTIERLDYSTGAWTDDKGGRNLIVVAQKNHPK